MGNGVVRTRRLVRAMGCENQGIGVDYGVRRIAQKIGAGYGGSENQEIGAGYGM